MTTINNWADMASKFINDLNAERAADPKLFARGLAGPKRAEAAIAQLDSLRQRLQGFVHA